ncbi:Pseudouridylate synthase 7 [Nymphon striatum]|nr:Pseudouridylate synthase 7 [Nymphon striatum]
MFGNGVTVQEILQEVKECVMCDEPEAKKIKLDSPELDDSNAVKSSQRNTTKLNQCEIDVGITEYITQNEPIFGVLKQRFSDFQVHEISTDNSIVKLKTMDAPIKVKKVCDISVLDVSIQEELQKLHEGTSEEPVYITIQEMNKIQRKAIHDAIKSHFPKLDSNTIEKDQSKVIKVIHKTCQQISRSNWPADRPPYTYFVLYKENKDTMEAINIISSKLKINPSNFGYAGTKDRRAKTSQLVSVKKVYPEKLLGLNKSLRQISIGNILFKDKPLKLGDLKGNCFSILLREINSSQTKIEPVLQSVKQNGFINYFGMQRFGTSEVPTQSIGKALLLSQWQEAIDLVLKPKYEDKYFSECKKIWLETKDAAKAYQKLPPFKKSSIEGHLLTGLMKHSKNDLVNAFNSKPSSDLKYFSSLELQIPRNTRLMYVHSYQSNIWNKAVSYRFKEFGMKPIAGDLVFSSDIDGHSGTGAKVKILTEEDVELLKFSIYDVVLPLPGYDVIYPENKMIKEFYKELLEKDGLDIDNMKVKVKTYSLSGSYRKIIVRPNEFTWSFHQYKDPTESLIISDIDELNNVEMPPEQIDGQYKALKLHLTLPSSSYATMALREIMKCDTSSSFQKSLNSLSAVKSE